jgi:two-component system, OmpR family, sensor histidine kinase PhoQ
MLSLNTRLLIAASIALAAFLGITGFVLDGAYRNSAENALKDRLKGYVNALIAASEPDDKGTVHLTHAIPELRFFTEGSGLYAKISSNKNGDNWVSPSMTGLKIDFTHELERASRHFEYITASDGSVLYAFNIGVTWDDRENAREGYTFSVAEDLKGFNADINGFRKLLWGWLGAVAFVLLVVQGSVLRWGLLPLRRVAADLRAIDAGSQTELQGQYPKELRRLTGDLNALIRNEREHLERYRNTLGDLAHSLKTPLALLRSEVESQDNNHELRSNVQQQVDRMSQIIEYQLQRAATSGRTVLVAPISIRDISHKVVTALDKVYADKHVKHEFQIDENIRFYGDESDLMELLGNLIENAYKWCRNQVRISASQEIAGNKRRPGLTINIEDDGPGIPGRMAHLVIQRGARADKEIGGHGIGLAMVQDIMRVYEGRLDIRTSSLGGACLSACFPSVD